GFVAANCDCRFFFYFVKIFLKNAVENVNNPSDYVDVSSTKTVGKGV
ncbi:hypothetical protein SOVF_209980, partial [Spinacia oleracea]